MRPYEVPMKMIQTTFTCFGGKIALKLVAPICCRGNDAKPLALAPVERTRYIRATILKSLVFKLFCEPGKHKNLKFARVAGDFEKELGVHLLHECWIFNV